MDHQTLIEQHEAIDAVTLLLLAHACSPVPPGDTSRLLGLLAALVRDHLAFEDPVIYETVAVTRDTRHGPVAALSAAEFEQLKQDWTAHLYRWDEAAIAAGWDGFVEDSRSMLERLRTRVARETAILYSLAQHYDVIGAGDIPTR